MVINHLNIPSASKSCLSCHKRIVSSTTYCKWRSDRLDILDKKTVNVDHAPLNCDDLNIIVQQPVANVINDILTVVKGTQISNLTAICLICEAKITLVVGVNN